MRALYESTPGAASAGTMLQEIQLLLAVALQRLAGLPVAVETDVNTASARAMPTLPVAGIESTEYLSRQGSKNCGEASGEDENDWNSWYECRWGRERWG